MAGRKPKLNEIKILEGNPGKRKIKNKITGIEGFPLCPSHLSRCAKLWWKRTVPQLKKLGVLSNLDLGILEAAATAYSLMDTAIKAMGDDLPLDTNYKGGDKVQSMHLIYKQNAELYIRLSSELGLSPIARQKIQSSIETGQDYFDSIL